MTAGEGYYESASGLGDQYLVRLSVAGKWRAVTWERIDGPEVAPSELDSVLAKDPQIEGKYHVCGSFSVWLAEEMVRDSEVVGLYSFEVRLLTDGGDFQILRNADRCQVFHPEFSGATDDCHVLGPSSAPPFLHWSLDGKAGDVFRIEFQRSMAKGLDTKKISWRKVKEEPLSKEETLAARRGRYCITGTWGNWSKPQEMKWNGDEFAITVE